MPKEKAETAKREGKFSVFKESWYIFSLAIYKARGISSWLCALTCWIYPLKLFTTKADDTIKIPLFTAFLCISKIGPIFCSICIF